MRKFVLLLFCMACSGYVSAQRPLLLEDSYKLTGIPDKSPDDTLWPGYSLGATQFVLIADSNGGYVLGNNSYGDICKGQQFNVDSGYIITGAIYWFAAKKIHPVSNDSIRFIVWRLDSLQGYTSAGYGFSAPGTELASVKAALPDVDTASFLSLAYAVTFPAPVTVYFDYVIGFDMSGMSTDTIGLVSTSNGSGGGAELVWEKWGTNNTWHTLQASGWGFPALLDIDAMILPIIDLSEYGISAPLINGISCRAYPNPAADYLNLEIELQYPSAHNSIQVLDATGNLFLSFDPGQMQVGNNSVSLNTSAWPCGSYILVLHSDRNLYAFNVIISR